MAVNQKSLIESVPRGLLIGGKWREGGDGRTIAVEDPSSGSTIAHVADATVADGKAALDAAVAAQEDWAATAPRDRGEILRSAFERITGRNALRGKGKTYAARTIVFEDTVRDNVTLGAPLTDEEVWDALRTAQADGFVQALPGGLDARLGERGTSLSGGQRQRLSLARALARRPRLLVLDDATSAVDPDVEQRILGAMRQKAGRATMVLIAYRKATISLADEVLFLADGHIVDRGPHEQLLARNADYAQLVNAYEPVEVGT